MKLEEINSLYSLLKTPILHGRYITNSHIEKCFVKIPKQIVSIAGTSVEDRPIYSLKYGSGPLKILMWSQMHGNESTTTKALFDCFNLFATDTEISNRVLESCTLLIIPVLNPDGAEHYTRINANKIDLNRDAQNLAEPESRILRELYTTFKPDFCFNLHGQRTIFGAGALGKPATLSFLAPSQDKARTLTPNRKIAMSIISDINELMITELPNGIGRYDDGFNLNCVGDTFQSFGVPTLLYEAGHYPNDYDREEVRRLIFISILKALDIISNGASSSNYKGYFKIPENKKNFYDIIIRNARTSNEQKECVDIAIQYKEELKQGEIEFCPIVVMISNLDNFYGHLEIDAFGGVVKNSTQEELKLTNANDFVFINTKKISLKP